MPILMKKISIGDYIREGPQWEKLSNAAKDLIESLLQIDPVKRLTPTEVLAHPWFV
jgi:calcium/calmodulin-dependent protein kinase I